MSKLPRFLKLAVALTSCLGALVARAASPPAPASPTGPKLEQATFAGGCFWSMELAFRNAPGVADVKAGFTGGRVAYPSYEEVSAGNTGHVEAVLVSFDPKVTSYSQLLEVFWHHVDP